MTTHVTRAKAAEKTAKKHTRHSLRATMTKTERKMERNVTKMIITTILQKEDEMKSQNRIRLPKNFIKDIVQKYQPALPLLTVKSLNNALMYERSKRKNTKLSQSSASVDDNFGSAPQTKDFNPTTEEIEIATPRVIHNVGRPKGTTILSKHEIDLKVAACYNEVTLKFSEVREQGTKMTKNDFDELVSNVKMKLDLPEEILIKRSTVNKRITCKNLVLQSHEMKGGSVSPLSDVEPTFVEIILMMSKIKQPLTPPQIKDFINSSIEGTEYQKNLIQFKERNKCAQSEEKMGKVSSRYVHGFLKRWSHMISSKKPQRFELDRGQWAKYSNFYNMYDSIEKTLISSGVAK